MYLLTDFPLVLAIFFSFSISSGVPLMVVLVKIFFFPLGSMVFLPPPAFLFLFSVIKICFIFYFLPVLSARLTLQLFFNPVRVVAVVSKLLQNVIIFFCGFYAYPIRHCNLSTIFHNSYTLLCVGHSFFCNSFSFL